MKSFAERLQQQEAQTSKERYRKKNELFVRHERKQMNIKNKFFAFRKVERNKMERKIVEMYIIRKVENLFQNHYISRRMYWAETNKYILKI